MPWIELELKPESDWNETSLEDWSSALNAFTANNGLNTKPKTQILPGYQVLKFGEDRMIGDIILSASERLVLLEGWKLDDSVAREFAYFVVRFAREMGAVGLCTSVEDEMERNFWQKMGGVIHQDPIPLNEPIVKEKINVERLSKHSLLVTFSGKPVLCLEPIACNAHGPGPVSLSQRRLEKSLGGQPLGFASRVAMHCPWEITKLQWDDLLAFSRLQAFDVLAEIVFSQNE